MDDIFTSIYQNRGWNYGSGEGSSSMITAPYRLFIERFIKDNNVKSVVDLGCGDWQFSKLIDWNEASYIGLDIVDSIIFNNKLRFGNSNTSFIKTDIYSSQLPSADLCLIKDVLQHWGNSDIINFLPNLNRFKFSIVTNSINGGLLNSDIKVGGFRPLDLRLEPFNWQANEVLKFGNEENTIVSLLKRTE